MPVETHPPVLCPSCGKQFRWKPELAGKRAKCKCGGVMTVPEQEPPDSEHDIYGISDSETDPALKRTKVAPRRAAATAVAGHFARPEDL